MRAWRELTFIVATLSAAAPLPVHAQDADELMLLAQLGGIDSMTVIIEELDNHAGAAGIREACEWCVR